ncbi:hypothetical protein U1Q18_030821 [Sarracenia purpurea var. burkii]
MTVMSTEESEEEHCSFFFQLLLDQLRYSAACFLALARYPVTEDMELMIIVEKFTFELLDVTKISISEIKNLPRYFSSEVHIPQYFSVPYKPLVDMHHSSSNVHKNPSSASTFPNDRNSHATDLSVHENSSLNAAGSDNSVAGSDNSAAVSDNSAAVSNHSAASSDSSCVPITETCPPASLPRIHAFGLEVLKVAELVVDAVVRLCKVYSSAVSLDFPDAIIASAKDRNNIDGGDVDKANHVVNVAKCAVKQLCELGVLAANGGGSLVAMLNLSWKGVVTLLQLGNGTFAIKFNVEDILLTLVSLSNESLRFAAETWSSLLTETVSVSEAKRIFLPVKFYLINAVRISSQCPRQAFSVYEDITLCVMMISTFRILLSKEELLKSASEVLVELLEPISFHLLNSLLNSTQLNQDDKFLILDWLFPDENDLNFLPGDPSNGHKTTKMDAIFSLGIDNIRGARILLLGRVSVFLNLLKNAADLEDVRLGIARKLGWLLMILVDEDVYSSCLSLQIPIPYGSGKTSELAYQPMYFSVLHALKTFMIVVSSTLAWREMESFLVENILHPHFFCWEIVMELWCFLVRHAEVEMVNDIIDKLCLLLMFVASSESVLVPDSGLRKIVRSICMLLMYVSQATVDRVYNTIVGSNKSQLSSVVFLALLMEGFPLNFLSDKMKRIATQRIVSEYFEFMECFDDASLSTSGSGVFGAPVFALSAALQSL